MGKLEYNWFKLNQDNAMSLVLKSIPKIRYVYMCLTCRSLAANPHFLCALWRHRNYCWMVWKRMQGNFPSKWGIIFILSFRNCNHPCIQMLILLWQINQILTLLQFWNKSTIKENLWSQVMHFLLWPTVWTVPHRRSSCSRVPQNQGVLGLRQSVV